MKKKFLSNLLIDDFAARCPRLSVKLSIKHIFLNFALKNVVEWLKRCDCDRHGLGSKIYSRDCVLSLGKTLCGTFPCLVVLASSFKLQSYLY